ncbi:MAG: hypothetical protein LJE60_04855 [Thiocapsa sp.]|nr:hypothetical protein [Thiocapsa sp.]
MKTLFAQAVKLTARSRRIARPVSRWQSWLPWVLICPVACISGCAGVPTGDRVSEPDAVGASADSARPPQWRPGEPAGDAERRAPGGILFDDPLTAPVLFSQDPELLRAEVAAECLAARAFSQPDSLDPLVTGLYLSRVDPAEGTEALIRGDCGPVAEIVKAMVAKGGEAVLDPVVDRARVLSPPQARRVIETAAAAGLDRRATVGGLRIGPPRVTARHAMAYYPSAGQDVRIETADALDRLYRQAVPGYGIYTFIFVGAGLDRLAESDQARHRELFRLVETYAAVGGSAEGNPRRDAHTFVIPIDSERTDEPLFRQIATDLSDQMRALFVEDLRLRGQSTLADRMESGAGPFLVAGFEPDLLPGGSHAARLVADLSGIGVEHLYPIVDAFDRSVPAELSGRLESLVAVRDRLQGVLPSRLGDPESGAAARGDWVFLLGPDSRSVGAFAGIQPMLSKGVVARSDRSGI